VLDVLHDPHKLRPEDECILGEVLVAHAGTGAESIMKNEDLHDHSDSAYDMLEEYVIGCLGTESTEMVRTPAALYQKTHSWSNIDQVLITKY
jgi:hypothetical protein